MPNRHASTVGQRRHRRVSNYLLNRSFQLKYVGMILGLSILISFGLGSFLVEQMRENSRMLLLDTEMDPIFQEQVAQSDAESVLVLVGALLLFNLILGVGALIVTHRLAGPMFVFRRYLRMLGEGKIPEIRALRKGDEFEEVLQELRTTVRAVEQGMRQDLESVARIRGLLAQEAGPDLGAVQVELSRLEERKQGGSKIPPDRAGIESSS